MGDTDGCVSCLSLASISMPEETSDFRPIYKGASAAFCIQLFCIEEKYEARQVLVVYHGKTFLTALVASHFNLIEPLVSKPGLTS